MKITVRFSKYSNIQSHTDVLPVAKLLPILLTITVTLMIVSSFNINRHYLNRVVIITIMFYIPGEEIFSFSPDFPSPSLKRSDIVEILKLALQIFL